MTHSCIRAVWLTHAYVQQDSLIICSTWLIDAYVRHNSLMHMCILTHWCICVTAYVWRDSLMHVCDLTHWCICATWLTYAYVRHDSLMHLCILTHWCICVTWLTHAYVRHDSLMHMCNMTYRPTQSIMYVPLQVNRFQKSILLIVQYKYLKSCSGDFYSPESDPPHKIMRYWFYYSI